MPVNSVDTCKKERLWTAGEAKGLIGITMLRRTLYRKEPDSGRLWAVILIEMLVRGVLRSVAQVQDIKKKWFSLEEAWKNAKAIGTPEAFANCPFFEEMDFFQTSPMVPGEERFPSAEEAEAITNNANAAVYKYHAVEAANDAIMAKVKATVAVEYAVETDAVAKAANYFNADANAIAEAAAVDAESARAHATATLALAAKAAVYAKVAEDEKALSDAKFAGAEFLANEDDDMNLPVIPEQDIAAFTRFKLKKHIYTRSPEEDYEAYLRFLDWKESAPSKVKKSKRVMPVLKPVKAGAGSSNGKAEPAPGKPKRSGTSAILKKILEARCAKIEKVKRHDEA